MATLKGQNLRILASAFDGSSWACIGMATNCTITLTNNTEDASTKDDVGLASKPEVVSKAWSVQVDSLNVLNAAAMLTAIKSMQKVEIMWDEVGTSDNQTPVTGSGAAAYARKGLAYLSDLTISFNDRENAAKNCNLSVLPHSKLFHQPECPTEFSSQAATPRASSFACSSGATTQRPPQRLLPMPSSSSSTCLCRWKMQRRRTQKETGKSKNPPACLTTSPAMLLCVAATPSPRQFKHKACPKLSPSLRQERP